MKKQLQPKTTNKTTKRSKRPRRVPFLSLRWRFITPLFVVVLIVATAGAYVLALNISGGLQVSQENVLLQSSRTVADRTAQLYDDQRNEAQRTAFTAGLAEAVRDGRADTLEEMLRTLISIASLDTIITTNTQGQEVMGLQRVETPESVSFAISTGTDLSAEPLIRSVIDDAFVGATGFLRTPNGLMLFTAVPIYFGDEFIGVAMVGQRLSAVLADLNASANYQLALYGPDGVLLQTTLDDSFSREPLALSMEVFNQALLATQQIPVQGLQLEQQAYQASYQPFNFGPNTLGVVGTFMQDNIPYVTETGRQLTALLAATLAGAVVTVAFIGISRVSARAEKVARVAGALAMGHEQARTGMLPRDEISAMGYALDHFADQSKQKQDALYHALRKQRREFNHLIAVFESMPDGVIVQALDGRVMLMNERARYLLGSHRVFRSTGLHELSAVVGDVLGPSLAPGLYALGNPHRLPLDERILSAQAAAILSMSEHRLGTVILLRDITDQVRQERERDAMLQQLARDIQQPLANLGRMGRASSEDSMVKAFAREVTRQAVALQRMVVDMRELDNIDVLSVKRHQRPLRLDTLVWSVANEWRQFAQASGLTLHIIIERKGLYVLGDEIRLRWAMGNIIDNAIKYTPPGGALTLEIQEESNGRAHLRIRDNGVGISKEDRPYIFTRFYRGTPTLPDGQVIRVPGMGQGLYIAKQTFESHGGEISIKSSADKGTAVYMSLPLTSEVAMELPELQADMDGETVQLPEDVIIRRDERRQ